VFNRMVLGLLRSPAHGLLDPGMCELRYQGRRTGRPVALPVLYARHGDRFVVIVGDAPHKQWWRNFIRPAPVQVRRGGQLRPGIGRVVPPDDPSYPSAWAAYQHGQHVQREPTDQLVLIDFDPGRPPVSARRG
jgi:deazaflavin-dependent oxidoreductase (nitroreductase family)